MSFRTKNKLYIRSLSSLALVLALGACGDDSGDGDDGTDESKEDAGSNPSDAGRDSATGIDSGTTVRDASSDSSTTVPDAAAPSDASTTADTGTPDSSVVDSGTPDAGGTAVIPTFNGCAPANFQDLSAAATKTVAFGGATGLAYSPKCVTINVGQSVTFSGSFSSHRLRKGTPTDDNAGSASSPIVNTDTGNSKVIAFPTAETYPYFCFDHRTQNMVGVIHVK